MIEFCESKSSVSTSLRIIKTSATTRLPQRQVFRDDKTSAATAAERLEAQL
jgi:hypothetical protein